MHIAVCIKQTPAPAEARIDPQTRTLVREGVALVLSSIDRRALLEGLRLRSAVGGSVTVVTMGPPQARDALQECLALGADRAVHLTDAAFAGADTLATARALAAALRRLAPDLVLCGRFTIDSQTGQVPSEVAELLDLPQVTSARRISPAESPGTLQVERETDEGYERYLVPLPALVSVTELVIASRRPSPEELQTAAQRQIETWSAADIGGDPSLYGSAGSPTRVGELRSAGLERAGRVISGHDPDLAAREVADYLLANGLFQPRSHTAHRPPRRPMPVHADPARAIWVFAELAGGEPLPVTYELLGRAQELADGLGGEVAALLVGGPSAERHVGALGAHGADSVYLAADSRLATYDTDLLTTLVVDLVRQRKPHMLLLPSTTNGRDLAPRIAARLQVGLTGDCVGLELDGSGQVAQVKPAFGGNIVAPVYSRTLPLMATVRPGMLAAHEPDWTALPRVVPVAAAPDGTPGRVRLTGVSPEAGLGAARLDGADVVVAVGMGVGGPEGLAAVRGLADAANGALAASLRVAAAGWLPPQLQVGLTGRAVAPRFYIAIGVSGQPNHLVGARRAEHIIAINSSPDAPIFRSADLGVVCDWARLVPALTRALLAARSEALR